MFFLTICPNSTTNEEPRWIDCVSEQRRSLGYPPAWRPPDKNQEKERSQTWKSAKRTWYAQRSEWINKPRQNPSLFLEYYPGNWSHVESVGGVIQNSELGLFYFKTSDILCFSTFRDAEMNFWKRMSCSFGQSCLSHQFHQRSCNCVLLFYTVPVLFLLFSPLPAQRKKGRKRVLDVERPTFFLKWMKMADKGQTSVGNKSRTP